MFPQLVVNREPRLLYYATLESKLLNPLLKISLQYHVLNESQSMELTIREVHEQQKKECYSDVGKTTNSSMLAYCLVPTALNSITKNILLELFESVSHQTSWSSLVIKLDPGFLTLSPHLAIPHRSRRSHAFHESCMDMSGQENSVGFIILPRSSTTYLSP